MTLDYSTMLHQSRLGCTALALAVELPAVLHSFPLLCREGRGGGLVFNFQFLTRTQILSTAVEELAFSQSCLLQKVRSSTLQTGWFQKRFFILGICSYLPLYRQSKLKLWKKQTNVSQVSSWHWQCLLRICIHGFTMRKLGKHQVPCSSILERIHRAAQCANWTGTRYNLEKIHNEQTWHGPGSGQQHIW